MTALVTGGSRGIGRAVALKLAQEGARVIVHYGKNESAARAVAEEIGPDQEGNATRIVRADIGKAEEIEAMFAALADTRLDILVNNAGIWKPTPLGATSVAMADEMIDTNLRAPFLITQCALALLNDGARIVNVSSVAARTGVAGGRSLYGATKAAVESLTRNWAMELAPRRILVNAVAPGYVETDMTAVHLGNAATRERALVRHPLGKLGSADEVADVVAFLCSDGARFVTGQTINVSGGFVI